MRYFLLVALLVSFVPAQADILKDFDSLGGNDKLINRAKALEPNKDIEIVQNRVVKRKFRSEFSAGYNNIVGGDAFVQTQMLNLNYHFHINPRWTVGASYFSAFNQLSSEGETLINQDDLVPDVDSAKAGYEIVGNYSPIYGKLNVFNQGVVQFDIYGLISLGNIQLRSGETNTYSLGAGIGLWISQHLTTRMEIRQRFYEAKRFGGSTDMEITSLGFSFGYML